MLKRGASQALLPVDKIGIHQDYRHLLHDHHQDDRHRLKQNLNLYYFHPSRFLNMAFPEQSLESGSIMGSVTL